MVDTVVTGASIVPKLVSALKKCDQLEEGKSLHAKAVSYRCHRDKYVATSLIKMYSRCGEIESAKAIFDRMKKRDVVAWTSLITGYVENGEFQEAVEIFHAMDCEPNGFTYATVLKAYGVLAVENASGRRVYLENAIVLHERLRSLAHPFDVVVGNSLVDVYSKCGKMFCARDVFEAMPIRDVVTWSTLMMGYVDNGEDSIVLELYKNMDCVPNHVTFAAVLKACSNLSTTGELLKREARRQGAAVHRRIKELGLEPNAVVATSLMDFYTMQNSMESAQDVFDQMTTRTIVSWTCLLLGYVENGEYAQALHIFTRLDCEPNHVTYVGVIKAITGLVSNAKDRSEKQFFAGKGILVHEELRERGFETKKVVANSLLDMFSKAGNMHASQDMFDRMVNRDTVSWNSLILGYADNGECRQALSLLGSMDSKPNSSTLVAALKAAAALPFLPSGKKIHARACRLGLEHKHLVANSLVHFYGKCGEITTSEHVFGSMQELDRISWNALIGGYSMRGDTVRVFALAYELEEAGLEMDDVTFRSVLAACSHAGMVAEGSAYFDEMCKRNGRLVGPEHYNCMVDMQGRANRMDQAVELVEGMPPTHKKVAWLTLLGICRKWDNLEVARVAFEELVKTSQI